MNARSLLVSAAATLCAAAPARAEVPQHNPTSKIYVADTAGDTQITTALGVGILAKKAVYKGEGTMIDTKPNSNASIVLSNGTGIYFDVSSRTEIRAFVQAPFRPNRTDMEEEPSISRTRMYIDYGVVALSTSRMAAGSTLLVETPQGTASILGRQAVFQVGVNATTVSVLQGTATFQAGHQGPTYEVGAGQEIVVRPGGAGQPAGVDIREIAAGTAPGARPWLNERILQADAARKLVYFEVQDNPIDGTITLFDGESGGPGEIVPVPVTPANPPVEPTVSAANLSGQ